MALCRDGPSEPDGILVLGHFEQNGLCPCSLRKDHHGGRLPVLHLIGLDLDSLGIGVAVKLLKPFAGVHPIHSRVNRMRDFFHLSLCKVIQPPKVVGIPQLRNADSFGLIDFQAAEDDFLEVACDGGPHLAAVERQR